MKKIIFGCYTSDVDRFRAFVERAVSLGATHVTITAEDLPLAYWEERKNPPDPYPAWIMSNPGLLKILPPEPLRPFIPSDHGEAVLEILTARCAVLREFGCRAAFHTFEPQTLPDAVFEAYPDWRGPRVEHPERARGPYYAPSISHPEVLQLYTEAMRALLADCPEIEILQMRTNDSGAGIDWSEALYAGAQGHERYRSESMPDRILGFFRALQKPAFERGGALDVHMYNLKDEAQAEIVGQLEPGMAVDEQEGPRGQPFKYDISALLYYRRPFAPANGVPCPITYARQSLEAQQTAAERVFVNIADRHNTDLYLRIYALATANATASPEAILKQVATGEVGEAHADALLDVWRHLQFVEDQTPAVSAGGTIFILGCVHQRWLTRPFVPYPERLTDEEKSWWRPHQFQARTEADAMNLMDIQCTHLPTCRGGYDNVESILRAMREHIEAALDRLASIPGDKVALLTRRIHVFQCLLENVSHAVAYQRVIDTILHQPGREEEGLELLENIARQEIDTINRLMALLDREDGTYLLHRAKRPEEEYQRLLAPDVAAQLHRKIDVMQQHLDHVVHSFI